MTYDFIGDLTKVIRKKRQSARISSFAKKRTLKISGRQASRPGVAEALSSAAQHVKIVKLERDP